MSPVADALRTGRLIVTAGTGGVGKTTTAAALALLAAASGRRTAVLTIDPARRLAQTLGLSSMTSEGQQVGPNLHAFMLDMSTTADAMVRRFAPDEAAARRILDNPYYRAFSTSLAGTQEYMAVEQVSALLQSGAYDLVILDTPPAVHALDFLDAPERILIALDHKAVHWLYRGPLSGSAGYGSRLVGRGRKLVFRSLDKFTGGPFFEDLATFLQAFSALFDAFRTSSRVVHELLRGPDTHFLVVTSPSLTMVREAIAFRAELLERGFPFRAFICNRVHQPVAAAELSAVHSALVASGLSNKRAASLSTVLLATQAEHASMAARDAVGIAALKEAAGQSPSVVPLLAFDVHDLWALSILGRYLVGNFPGATGVHDGDEAEETDSTRRT